MRRGPISPNTHAMVEPFMAIVLIASPWIFGFSDVDSATTLAVVAGIAMLLAGQMTRWRYSVANIIPLRAHMMMDLGMGALLVLSPFIFGFSDEGGATRFMIAFGAIELLTALSTRWDEAEAEQGTGSRGSRAAHA